MQEVSTAYSESMKSTLRERGYIMISFGLVTQEAQGNATIEGDFNYYSSDKNTFDGLIDTYMYGTMEEDLTKVDGSMYFPPRNTSGAAYYDTGLISTDLVSEEEPSFVISINVPALRVMGLTINFGDNYPTAFTITTDSGQIITVTDNDSEEWITEEIIEEFTVLTLTYNEMLHPDNRARLVSFLFGYGLNYTNTSVTDSTLETYVSPIAEDIPQIDFSVTLTNFDKKFDTDNSDSPASFLETGQEMLIYYGYATPDANVEWFQGAKLWCCDWECTNRTVTIRTQDIFREWEDEYSLGVVNSAGVSLYDHAETIFLAAGLEEDEYYIDDSLKDIYTCNPLPMLPYRELLQIIANAACCVLTQSRDGIPQIIPSNTEPVDFTMEYMDMKESPTKNKQELVKDITVPYYVYSDAESESTLVTEDVTVSSGDTETFYMSSACYDYSALLDSETDGISITASSAYSVTVKYATSGTFRLQIKGYKYTISERYAVCTLNSRGSSIKWENPIVDRESIATALADWLGVYYSSRIEYEYATRGNPELDVGDIIYQENDYQENMEVMIISSTTRFNGAFSGEVLTRRWEG